MAWGVGITFPFITHASFYVPRWAFGLALNIKLSGVRTELLQMVALVLLLLGLTSIPSGLICKESSGGRLKLDGLLWQSWGY